MQLLTVMRNTSASHNAFFTSGSFSGRIIAMISFIFYSVVNISNPAYASALCSAKSKPLSSSSRLTLNPMSMSSILKKANISPNVHTNTAPMPTSWLTSCAVPPPKNNPLTPPNASWANKPTASVPHTPHVACADTAPTGSSTPILSKNSTENTYNVPAIRPITTALNGLTLAVPAVMPTRPPMVAPKVNETSGFL